MMKSRNDGLREEGEKNPFRPLYPIDLSFFFFFFLNLYIFEFYQTRKFDTKREILSLSTRERYINDKYEEALARRSFIINK